MTTKLKLFTKQVNDATYQTIWITGKLSGTINCVIVGKLSSNDLIKAELKSLHLLLIDNHLLLGQNRSGNNLEIKISQGAIKKLQKQKSAKTDLIRFASFLTSRFADAHILVSKDKIKLTEDINEQTVNIYEATSLYDSGIINLIGKVIIKAHVVDAMFKRAEMKTKSNAWRRLRELLQRESLINWIPPKFKITHDFKKYGKSTKYLIEKKSGWRFIMIQTGNDLSLVTIYQHTF
jgi:hypothetical protein